MIHQLFLLWIVFLLYASQAQQMMPLRNQVDQISRGSCMSLLSAGAMLGNTFVPSYCQLFNYTQSLARKCFSPGHHHSIVFAGDSRIRQQFYNLHIFLSGLQEPQDKVISKNLTVNQCNITLEFYWQPMMNSNLTDVYRAIMDRPLEASPAFLLTGLATWELRKHNWGENLAEFTVDYEEILMRVRPLLEALSEKTTIIWQLQDPVIPELTELFGKVWTNPMLDIANAIATRVFSDSSIYLWNSSQVVARHFGYEAYDGFHIGNTSLYWDGQMLLNFYCNKYMSLPRKFCCSSNYQPGVGNSSEQRANSHRTTIANNIMNSLGPNKDHLGSLSNTTIIYLVIWILVFILMIRLVRPRKSS